MVLYKDIFIKVQPKETVSMRNVVNLVIKIQKYFRGKLARKRFAAIK